MTEEEKDILIAKMIDAPSALTQEELALISHDDELREIYETTAAIFDTTIKMPEIDTAEEWALLKPRLKRRSSVWRWIGRVAALWVFISAAEVLGVRIFDRQMTPEVSPVLTEIYTPADATLYIANPQEPPVTSPVNHQTYKSSSLPAPTLKEEESEFDTEFDDIDVDEYIRVQQARIDNDLAVLEAENIQDDYMVFSQVLDMMGIEDRDAQMTVRKLTLQ